MIEISGLCKSYGDFPAVQDLSFTIAKQDHGITALLGPNGAGKSTTMRLMTGYLEADAGEIQVNGLNVRDEEERVEAKRIIGYLPETTPLYPEMLVSEYLEFMGRVRGLSGATLERRARQMVDQLELGSHLFAPIGILSKGFRQRAALAATLIHDPEVIILDEPTSGLDPNQIQHIRSLIREIGARSTLILSTHILQEVEDICDRVIIVSRGRIAADERTSELRTARAACRVVARSSSGVAGIQQKLNECSLVQSVELREDSGPALPEGYGAFVCRLAEDSPEKLFAFVAEQGWEVREVAPLTRSLQEIFHELTHNG